jgi:hypothetical protein
MTPIPITERMSDGTSSGVNMVKTNLSPAFGFRALSREIILGLRSQASRQVRHSEGDGLKKSSKVLQAQLNLLAEVAF